eukprot:482826-Amphidinium_carterae.1
MPGLGLCPKNWTMQDRTTSARHPRVSTGVTPVSLKAIADMRRHCGASISTWTIWQIQEAVAATSLAFWSTT